MNEKKIEPTQAMVEEALFHRPITPDTTRAILRAALNHPDAAGLFECDHTDYVHVDEAATRVEAAREQGWDDAADWVKQREAWTDEELRAANPHRPAQELPTKAGTLIIPADGREYIEAEVWGETYHASEAILLGGRAWLGAWRSPHGIQTDVTPDQITTGTWKVDGEDAAR